MGMRFAKRTANRSVADGSPHGPHPHLRPALTVELMKRSAATVYWQWPQRFVGALVMTLAMSSYFFGQQETADAPQDPQPTQQTAEQEAQPAQSGLMRFRRDIAPILEEHCLKCHGPKVAKNDFRVDDQDSLMGYITAGDVAGSSLWNDYIITEDESMRMPPKSEPAMTGAKLAAIKLWIEEGASWEPAPAEVDAAKTEATTTDSRSKPARVAAFLGLFHPAAVHIPIALLFVSFIFLIGTIYNRAAFESAAFHCLWVGALGAVASCMLGWFYADVEGYSGPKFVLSDALERHRLAGLMIATLSIVLTPIASRARSVEKIRGTRLVWFLGAFALAILVGIAGHQGGELTYGEKVFSDAFSAIFRD